MSQLKLPNTDSITELAEFWDTHDLTDFEDQLEEVSEPVFERKKIIKIPLASKEMNAIQKIAKSKGIGSVDLIRSWFSKKFMPNKVDFISYKPPHPRPSHANPTV